jgi:hypothetical protein|tara:strand:- start:54 stop:248 length:195 start_codon:yes stop_codon:yes gene_type:complete
MKIDRVIETVRRHKLDEMMTMGAGAIAGSVEAGDDPPVRRKKKPPVLGRGIMLGLRKRWSTGKV